MTISIPRTTATRVEAFVGMLPFLVFGIASMLTRLSIPFHGAYPYLFFYLLALVGLGVGWIRRFPTWSYGYLGWSLVFVWWWSNMYTKGLNILGYRFGDFAWGWRIWLPLGLVVLFALLWTHSLQPIKKFFQNIWDDWTNLSLVMYTFLSWLTYMMYDENHHPALLAFMLGTTLAASTGVWFFLRSSNSVGRMGALLGGFVGAMAFGIFCDATWDWAAYYHRPPRPPQAWYSQAFSWIVQLSVLFLFVVWPAILGLVRRMVGGSKLKEA